MATLSIGSRQDFEERRRAHVEVIKRQRMAAATAQYEEAEKAADAAATALQSERLLHVGANTSQPVVGIVSVDILSRAYIRALEVLEAAKTNLLNHKGDL